MNKEKILFLCTGNACRSQMAEGLVNHYLGDRYEAYSAGVLPARVSQRAIDSMAELGIDISGQRSKHLNEFSDEEFDHVITLCAYADAVCPVYVGKCKKVHIGFSDPMGAEGTEEEIQEAFRTVRDQIRERVFAYLEKHAAVDDAEATDKEVTKVGRIKGWFSKLLK
jgi:arsenate reductase